MGGRRAFGWVQAGLIGLVVGWTGRDAAAIPQPFYYFEQAVELSRKAAPSAMMIGRCLDAAAAVPTTADVYREFSPGMTVVRSSAGHTETLSFTEAEAKGLVRLRGANSISKATVELGPNADDVSTYTIKVDGGKPQFSAVDQGQRNDVLVDLAVRGADLVRAGSHRATYQALFGPELGEVASQAAIWRARHGAEVMTSRDPVFRWERSLDEYHPSPAALLSQYLRTLGLPPSPLVPGARERLGLMFGRELSPEEISAIESLYGCRLASDPALVKGFASLSFTPDGYSLFVDGKRQEFASLDDLAASLHKIKTKASTLVLARIAPDGSQGARNVSGDLPLDRLSAEEAKILADQGVNFLMDAPILSRPELPARPKRVIVVWGGSTEENARLFGGQPPSAVAPIGDLVQTLGPEVVRTVKDRKSLERAVAEAKAEGIRPVLIAHNEDGTVPLLDDESNIRELSESFDVISCSLFGQSQADLAFRSTNDIDIVALCQTFGETYNASAGADFYPALFSSYAQKHQEMHSVRPLLTAVGISSGIASGLVIVAMSTSSGEVDEPNEGPASPTQN